MSLTKLHKMAQETEHFSFVLTN